MIDELNYLVRHSVLLNDRGIEVESAGRAISLIFRSSESAMQDFSFLKKIQTQIHQSFITSSKKTYMPGVYLANIGKEWANNKKWYKGHDESNKNQVAENKRRKCSEGDDTKFYTRKHAIFLTPQVNATSTTAEANQTENQVCMKQADQQTAITFENSFNPDDLEELFAIELPYSSL